MNMKVKEMIKVLEVLDPEADAFKALSVYTKKLRGHFKRQRYVRKEIYSIETVFEELEKSKFKHPITLDGDEMKGRSLRYKVFYGNLECVECGVKGTYFAKEKTYGSKKDIYHLNLYGVNKAGKEVLMTKDHIFPKSLGGTDELSNLQTMCEHCNSKKGDTVIKKETKK